MPQQNTEIEPLNLYFSIFPGLTSNTESNNNTFGSESRSIFNNHHQNKNTEAFHPELVTGGRELLFKYLKHSFV